MAFNQDIRFGPPEFTNFNNPNNLYTFIKPSRIITNNIGGNAPLFNTGEDQWYFIDTDTGNFWYKNLGLWILLYTFGDGGGGAITDGSNVGIGNDIFKTKNGSVLEFKTIVSQPQSALESVLNLNDNPLNTEVNITGQSTVADITNYGINADQWIIDSQNTTVDANGNLQLYVKYLSAGPGILIQTETVGSDKRLVISSTYNPPPPSYAFGYLPDGNNYTLTLKPINLNLITLLDSNFYTFEETDWEQEVITDISYFKYIGTNTKRFRVSVDVGAQNLGTLNNQEQQITFVMIDDALNIVPSSSSNMNFLPIVGGSVVQSWSHSTFIFTPIINQNYTLGAIIRQVGLVDTNLNVFKTNITITEI